MKQFKDIKHDISVIKEELYKKMFNNVYKSNIDEFAKANDLIILKDKSAGIELWYGVKKDNKKELIFTYSPDDSELYSDYTVMDLRRGIVK